MSNKSSSRNKARVAAQNNSNENNDSQVMTATANGRPDMRTEENMVAVPTASVYTDVTNFLRVIVVNAWIIVLVVALGTAAAYLYVRSEPEIYEASGKVIVISPSGVAREDLRDLLAIYNELNTNVLGNYVQIMRSRIVADEARASLADRYSPELIADAELEITPVQNSSFITIEVRSTDTMLAVDMVNAVIEATRAQTPPSMIEVFPLEVQDPPVEPQDRIAPNVRLSVIFGAAGSAAVGVALAFLFDAFRQYRRNRRALQRA
jgi:capsular polysaccharide biosynthesis protein